MPETVTTEVAEDEGTDVDAGVTVGKDDPEEDIAMQTDTKTASSFRTTQLLAQLTWFETAAD